MAKNYILAEYRNETRKIEGDWSKKKYGQLVKAVTSRFGIDHDVDFRVFDKGANTYFTIDRSEMREIRKGGLVKVVRAKGSKAGGAKGGRGAGKATPDKSGRGDGRKAGRGKGKGGQNLPPGVPPYSKADDARRNAWTIGSRVELFSDRASKWVKGKIIDVFHDHEGEWLLVEYQNFRQKEIQRFSNYVRPESREPRKKKEDPMKRKRREETETQGGRKGGKGQGRREESGAGGKGDGRREKREKRTREKKVTTQSKFRKRSAKDDVEREEPAENEIQLKGNSTNLKQYVDRAAILFRGPLKRKDDEEEEEVKAPAAAEEPAAGGDAEAKAGDDDAKEVAPKKERKPRGPSRKFDVVSLVGIGRAMGHVVSCVELIKRIVPGLHQDTTLETVEFKDVYEPTEEGLQNVEVSRFVTRLKVTLAVNAKDLDTSSLGYQAPMAPDEFAANIEYKYPDEQREKRRQKGSRRRRREAKAAAAAAAGGN